MCFELASGCGVFICVCESRTHDVCVRARVCVCVCVCEHENMMETGFVLRVCVLAICKNDQQNVKK